MEPRVEVIAAAAAAAHAGTPRSDPQVVWQVVATAHATRREFEPIRENAATVVGRVVGEQPVQTVLLLAPAALAAEHLLVLEPALQHTRVIMQTGPEKRKRSPRSDFV